MRVNIEVLVLQLREHEWFTLLGQHTPSRVSRGNEHHARRRRKALKFLNELAILGSESLLGEVLTVERGFTADHGDDNVWVRRLQLPVLAKVLVALTLR